MVCSISVPSACNAKYGLVDGWRATGAFACVSHSLTRSMVITGQPMPVVYRDPASDTLDHFDGPEIVRIDRANYAGD